MAAVLSRTWCRTVCLKRHVKVTQLVSRCYVAASVNEDEGVLKKVKKFVFGETIEQPLEQSDSVYYELKKAKTPLVYSMDPSEIKQKFDYIVNELDHHSVDITDDLVKYKVLCRCHEEFGVLFPSFKLNNITQLQDIEDFYSSFKKPSTLNTFSSLDIENIPPNLKIGGRVPRK